MALGSILVYLLLSIRRGYHFHNQDNGVSFGCSKERVGEGTSHVTIRLPQSPGMEAGRRHRNARSIRERQTRLSFEIYEDIQGISTS